MKFVFGTTLLRQLSFFAPIWLSFCQVVISICSNFFPFQDYAVQRLLPAFLKLSKDSIWGVRKGCVDNMIGVANGMGLDVRVNVFVPMFEQFTKDVRRSFWRLLFCRFVVTCRNWNVKGIACLCKLDGFFRVGICVGFQASVVVCSWPSRLVSLCSFHHRFRDGFATLPTKFWDLSWPRSAMNRFVFALVSILAGINHCWQSFICGTI